MYIDEIALALRTVAGTISLFGSFLLFLHKENIRSRYILAWLLLFFGVGYFILVVLGHMAAYNEVYAPKLGFLAPFPILYGCFFSVIMLYYLIEVVRPGWLTWKHVLWIFLPYFCIVGGYYIILLILKEPVLDLQDKDDMLAHLNQFNVWFRFVFFVMMLLYLFFMNWVILSFQFRYKAWCEQNFSSFDRINISWLRWYEVLMLCVSVSFITIICFQHPVNYMLQPALFIVFFIYVINKALYHESPYPEGFFRNTLKEEEAEIINASEAICINQVDIQPKEESGFIERLPYYKDEVEKWMITSQPYLRPNFKLLDVAEVLPLNRSYLSRVFNEAFGTTFSQIVQYYRIEEAKRLLIECPNLTVNQLFDKCGFISINTFHHVFQKSTGMTPKQYRSLHLLKK